MVFEADRTYRLYMINSVTLYPKLHTMHSYSWALYPMPHGILNKPPAMPPHDVFTMSDRSHPSAHHPVNYRRDFIPTHCIQSHVCVTRDSMHRTESKITEPASKDPCNPSVYIVCVFTLVSYQVSDRDMPNWSKKMWTALENLVQSLLHAIIKLSPQKFCNTAPSIQTSLEIYKFFITTILRMWNNPGWSTGRSVRWSVSSLVGLLVGLFVGLSVFRSVVLSFGRWVSRSFCLSVGRSVGRSVFRLVARSFCLSVGLIMFS